MSFQKIRVFNFRNLRDGEIAIPQAQVFFVGENGQGKTNFLEALYLLSYGGSFRTRRDAEVIKHGTAEAALSATFASTSGIETIDIRYQNGKKRISVNETLIADRREIVSRFPVVLFQHDDLRFVNGTPDMQRFFVDQTLSLYEPLHIDDLRTYRKILRNRNQALKDGNRDVLGIYDRQLAESGRHVQQNRFVAIAAFNEVFRDLFREISGLSEELELVYKPSWRDAGSSGGSLDEIIDLYQKKRQQEMAVGTTLLGPHRDRVAFEYEGRNFLEEASTGQQRLTSLILRIAQARLFHKKTQRLPVLLLDDVLLELDPGRRERCIQSLPPSEQRIFTFLPGEPYDAYLDSDTLVYSVQNGEFKTS